MCDLTATSRTTIEKCDIPDALGEVAGSGVDQAVGLRNQSFGTKLTIVLFLPGVPASRSRQQVRDARAASCQPGCPKVKGKLSTQK